MPKINICVLCGETRKLFVQRVCHNCYIYLIGVKFDKLKKFNKTSENKMSVFLFDRLVSDDDDENVALEHFTYYDGTCASVASSHDIKCMRLLDNILGKSDLSKLDIRCEVLNFIMTPYKKSSTHSFVQKNPITTSSKMYTQKKSGRTSIKRLFASTPVADSIWVNQAVLSGEANSDDEILDELVAAARPPYRMVFDSDYFSSLTDKDNKKVLFDDLLPLNEKVQNTGNFKNNNFNYPNNVQPLTVSEERTAICDLFQIIWNNCNKKI
ncbi:uncharacterized protein LOC119663511 [Teleopsis dalmanni]|uniref:uncharacterized protein LOC119663344 n=1 Tax=Teleopsis dalmanni TaxID=139649 RepID=UPI0018CFCA09|nr:uncharacterized protein LOC119663344 [Teleopsis dalmanni]XP_037929044.1 uncharacterized protein LOC119663511 [Teleopsis dalmanni]